MKQFEQREKERERERERNEKREGNEKRWRSPLLVVEGLRNRVSHF